MEKRIATMRNWMLVAVYSSPSHRPMFLDMITESMIKNKNLKFCCEKDSSIVLIGDVYGREGWTDGLRLKTSAVVSVEEGIVTTLSGSKYKLGKMNPDYEMFVRYVEANKPVLYNFVIGENLSYPGYGKWISGNVYVDGDVKFIKSVVMEQDFKKHTVTIDGIEYFVNWLSTNLEFRARLNPRVKVRERIFADDPIFGLEIDALRTYWDADFEIDETLFNLPKGDWRYK